MTNYRIVRRAYSNYTDMAVTVGQSYLDAITLSEVMERDNSDGEYLVRKMDQPNWEPGSSYQSGFDWL